MREKWEKWEKFKTQHVKTREEMIFQSTPLPEGFIYIKLCVNNERFEGKWFLEKIVEAEKHWENKGKCADKKPVFFFLC